MIYVTGDMHGAVSRFEEKQFAKRSERPQKPADGFRGLFHDRRFARPRQAGVACCMDEGLPG